MVKCWKKSRYGIIGWRKKSSKFLVTIESSSWGNTYDRAYLVKIIRNGKRLSATKKFKTKPQAMKFARSYMKKKGGTC